MHYLKLLYEEGENGWDFFFIRDVNSTLGAAASGGAKYLDTPPQPNATGFAST